jgi:hypothetical protein
MQNPDKVHFFYLISAGVALCAACFVSTPRRIKHHGSTVRRHAAIAVRDVRRALTHTDSRLRARPREAGYAGAMAL